MPPQQRQLHDEEDVVAPTMRRVVSSSEISVPDVDASNDYKLRRSNVMGYVATFTKAWLLLSRILSNGIVVGQIGGQLVLLQFTIEPSMKIVLTPVRLFFFFY
jgi:hypothetical protein